MDYRMITDMLKKESYSRLEPYVLSWFPAGFPSRSHKNP